MSAEQLFDESIDVWHRPEVLERWEAVCAECRLQFAPCVRLDVRVEKHREEEPVQDGSDLREVSTCLAGRIAL